MSNLTLKQPEYRIVRDKVIDPPWWAFWRSQEVTYRVVGGHVELYNLTYEDALWALYQLRRWQ